MRYLRTGALAGLLFGLGVLAVVWFRAAAVGRGMGSGEAVEYFATYALLLGAPVSLIASLMMQVIPGVTGTLANATLAMSLLGNWMLVGTAIAFVIKRIRRVS